MTLNWRKVGVGVVGGAAIILGMAYALGYDRGSPGYWGLAGVWLLTSFLDGFVRAMP